MNLKIVAILFCLCIACYAIAQQIAAPADTTIPTTIKQRHAGSDAVLAIINMNTENRPIVLQHYSDAETSNLAKEMADALQHENMEVRRLEAFTTMHPWDNPKHYNFTFQMTDSVLYIKAYPIQKKK